MKTDKCELCGQLIEVGTFNMLDHIEKYHSRTTQVMTLEEAKKYIKELIKEND